MEQIRGFIRVRVFTLFLLTVPSLLAQDSLSKAEDLYRRTAYQISLATIRESGETSARAYCLAGKDHFMLGDYKEASEAFERAFAIEPANAHYALWLGRSFGRRAETAAPFLGPRYAAKARGYFEKAVALDPHNEEALSDLFDYYLEAPGFLGGGFDKAEQVAKRMGEQNPAEGAGAQAQLADRRKQFDTAEDQIRRAIESAPRKMQRALDSPQAGFSRAQTYVERKRNLKSDLTRDDSSRRQAEKPLQEASGI